MTQSGALHDPDGLPIRTFTRNQELPVVTALNGNWFAVWEDRRNGRRTHCTRIDPGGAVAGSSGIAISFEPDCRDQSTLMFDGTSYLTLWLEARGTQARVGSTARTSAPAANSPFREGKDSMGEQSPMGVYLLQLEADGATETRAVLVLK